MLTNVIRCQPDVKQRQRMISGTNVCHHLGTDAVWTMDPRLEDVGDVSVEGFLLGAHAVHMEVFEVPNIKRPGSTLQFIRKELQARVIKSA